MKFKLEKLEEERLTCSVEHEGFVIVVDFPRQVDAEGGVNSENAKFLNDEAPDVQLLAQMMQQLGSWVVANHSDKFFKESKSDVFLNELKNIMKERGVTQYRLSQLTGISNALIKRYFDLKVTPSLDNIIKMVNALGFDLELRKK